MKILVFQVVKSIEITMLLVRVGQAVNPVNFLITLKTMIMIKIKKITMKKVKEVGISFVKSMVTGFALVEKTWSVSL